jgi:D-arabinose 1-dehydrogenase-like Zn-dependent alcohol dehydrogenase
VLVKVLRLGVDGTDKEINAAEYGAAPSGDDYLVTGHESFGQVVEVGCQRVAERRPHGRRRPDQGRGVFPGWLAQLLATPRSTGSRITSR